MIHKDERRVNLANASSGQQEILPLLIILKLLIEEKVRISNENNSTIYIEEPEAHLFPNAQKVIVKLLARLCDIGRYQIFITTHSPYLLSSINNHFIAGSIINTSPELNSVYKIIDKKELLYTSDSTAYSLSKGKCENLIDHKEGLIIAEVLDSVSNTIADEFDQLINIKYNEGLLQ